MTWQNRIVGHGEEAPDQLLANPRNWRIHPKAQSDALAGMLGQVGWVQDVIVNRRTGHVVDGHLRVALAISREEPAVPVVYVDLEEEEERLVLAALDPLAAMAATDKDQIAALVGELRVDDEALAGMLAGLAEMVGEGEFPDIPSGEGSGFRQMTFTVSERQFEVITAALVRAKAVLPPTPEDNENSNGNALAAIAEAYP